MYCLIIHGKNGCMGQIQWDIRKMAKTPRNMPIVIFGCWHLKFISNTYIHISVGTTKLCHNWQNLLLNNRLGALGPLNLVYRGYNNNFILKLIGNSSATST